MINKDKNSLPLFSFPISGRDVCDFLKNVLRDGELCLVKDVETLCSEDCESLGDLWHRVRASHKEILTKEDLLAILMRADQVITLDVCIESDHRRNLYIDDGELIENAIEVPSL
ncbi:hypothetical protein ACQUJS_24320 [Ralstonia pseudosolanacearum]